MDCRNRRSGRRSLAILAAILSVAGAAEAAGEDRDRPRERSEWNASFRKDASGRILSENRLKALAQTGALPVDPSMRSPGGLRSTTLSWEGIGPQPIQSKPGTDRNWGKVSGRVDALAVHPANPSVVLLGSATGGIWKSTDSGSTWRPVSDSAPSLATSSIAFSPSNPSIVFATTGELDSELSEETPSTSFGTYLGSGLLKSLDAGETWFRVDQSLPANAVFSRVLVDPRNSQNVIVGVDVYQNIAGDSVFIGGVYRSTNGGVTFSRAFEHLVTDLAQDPNDPSRLYLAATDTGCGTCPNGGVYVSTDSGLTWKPVLTPNSAIGMVKIGVSRTNPATIYASIVDGSYAHSDATGIFVSTDAGNNWTSRSVDPKMCPSTGNQCDYDHFIAAHPSNPNVVYFGSIDLYKSVDGAQTWSPLTIQYRDGRAEPVHPDQHTCAIVASSPNTIYFGNDGGAYKTTDGGQSFQNLNATLSLTQFNTIALHPSNPSVAIGGTQDNANVRYTGSSLWQDVTSGDGGFDLIRRDNPSEVLSAHYQAYFNYSSDGGATFDNATACGALMDCDKGEPLESMRFYPPATAAPSAPATVFFATNRIWANPTFGRDPAQWAPRSSGKITNSRFTAIAVNGNGSGVIWAGSQTGSVFFSSDGGATFASRFSGLPSAIVTSIVIFSSDGRSAYVTFGGFLGSPSRHVFYTTNAGQSWTNMSSNLPDIPVLSLAVNPADQNDIFVGTDIGVFRNPSGSSDWFVFNSGMPVVPVYALAFSPADGRLYAATYGRGVFRIGAGSTGPCVAAADTLCLNGGRFRVRVSWRAPSLGTSGAGMAVPVTGDTGSFWFFSAGNIELVVKVVDGRGFNNRFWVFYGALSNVEYTITVTDTATGAVRTYFNPNGQLASVADTSAFAGLTTGEKESKAQSPKSKVQEDDSPGLLTPEDPPDLGPSTLDLGHAARRAASAACSPGAAALCLNASRFRVQVSWRVPSQGTSGVGQAVALTGDTGYFWFFSPGNIELVVKVVDGRAFNNRFWVFFGALSDVEYTITVTDTLTGAVRTYFNPSGQLASVADTAAF